MTKKTEEPATPAPTPTSSDETPAKPKAAAPVMPHAGGSYIRQADGSLVKQED